MTLSGGTTRPAPLDPTWHHLFSIHTLCHAGLPVEPADTLFQPSDAMRIGLRCWKRVMGCGISGRPSTKLHTSSWRWRCGGVALASSKRGDLTLGRSGTNHEQGKDGREEGRRGCPCDVETEGVESCDDAETYWPLF